MKIRILVKCTIADVSYVPGDTPDVTDEQAEDVKERGSAEDYTEPQKATTSTSSKK